MARPSNWTLDMHRQAVEMRKGGTTYPAIAKALGVSECTARYHLVPGEARRRCRKARTRARRLRRLAAMANPEPSIRVWCRVKGAAVARLLELAAARGCSRHAVARELLEQALDPEQSADFVNL